MNGHEHEAGNHERQRFSHCRMISIIIIALILGSIFIVKMIKLFVHQMENTSLSTSIATPNVYDTDGDWNTILLTFCSILGLVLALCLSDRLCSYLAYLLLPVKLLSDTLTNCFSLRVMFSSLMNWMSRQTGIRTGLHPPLEET